MSRKKLLTTAGVLASLLVVGLTVGPLVYEEFVVGDQPDELALPSAEAADSSADDSDGVAADDAALDGTWQVGDDSVAGYRVDEVLFGRDVTVVGRTDQVTGGATVTDGVLSDAKVTVDMASVATDEAQRDAKFRGDIMDTDTYPTTTFQQADAVDLPATSGRFTVTVPGKLTVRGVTRDVDVELEVQAAAEKVDVVGSIDVTFSDYEVPDPGFSGVTVEDSGTIEFLLNLTR
jgi:polyisoprenoid-binding protein YceI